MQGMVTGQATPTLLQAQAMVSPAGLCELLPVSGKAEEGGVAQSQASREVAGAVQLWTLLASSGRGTVGGPVPTWAPPG